MFFNQFINTIQNEWKHHHDFHPHNIPTVANHITA